MTLTIPCTLKGRRGRYEVVSKLAEGGMSTVYEGKSSRGQAIVVKEASGGSLDLAGSSFLELQNATDSLRDHFHDEDDPLVPTVVGLVFGLAGLTFTAILPDALAIATRRSVREPGFIVVSFNCAGIISPRPLKRPISTFTFALNSLLSNLSRCASSRA